ncbi:MAG: hypothetical protein HYX92_09655 [Chloroflexi bacterium]|nr:hypothetical protein [Chloroflexota bacterium]
MATQTDVLLNPIGEVDAVALNLASRLDTLEGKIGCFIDNNKINSDVYLERVEEVLSAKYGLAGAVRYKKPDTARPTPPEVLDDLAKKAAFVVHAHGD